MIISLINRTKIPDREVLLVIRAINRQLAEDFSPHWNIHAQVKLEGTLPGKINVNTAANLRGNAIVYLADKFKKNDPLGFHDLNNRGIPFGIVYTELATKLNEPWSTTLSHEVLELAADAEVNRLAIGPHPNDPDHLVFHWYEMCDAVQDEHYAIDGIDVSNFVLPLYFTGGDEKGGRNDFLGNTHNGKRLTSFGINPGGYVGFYDPALDDHDQVFADSRAKQRGEVKSKVGFGRRSMRYKFPVDFQLLMQGKASPKAPAGKKSKQRKTSKSGKRSKASALSRKKRKV